MTSSETPRNPMEPHVNKPRKKAASGRRKPASGGWRLHDDRPPTFRGWISTDEGEIGRREWRGRTEIVDVHRLDGSPHPFGDYRVTSSNGSSYAVEIRSLATHVNSCECGDHRTNRLGTCKHIEGVLHHLRGTRATSPRRRKPKESKEPESSGRIEIFLDERDDRAVRMTVPEAMERTHPAFVREAERHCRSLRRQSRKALDALRHMARAHPRRLRVSRSLEPWLDARKAPARRRRERARFAAQLETGRRSFGFLKHPLLPYQVEGALHLAFGERALLADDMGLGKTVQAIAACALLRELRGVERVLVVSPASLKAEWEEQIAKFSDLPSTIVLGSRPARCAAYRRRTFFTLCNYEQVVADGDGLLDALRPDVVILDEAQRIKNWQTKTANAVKKLRSRYAFVLTGTPLENRIDEIYSIVQFLDPELLGPLFRFNREFYELDEKGKPSGFRNLDELARRVSSVMLRRRKEDVEGELPGRTVKTFFVPMTEAQTGAYEDYDHYVKRLAAIAAKRPLTKEEFDRLQKFLACMRMVCDTPYILDDESRDCPKMEEMERLLPGLLEDPERKIIVFSEWVRMLELVREYAVAAGIEFAWHTGSVPQPRRRAEIRRFREDPECRLFLSSESGGVGLNLQVADTVVNMDQPWNPARLEQRIARAWRKHQTRPVTVINLVSEDTIEHRMLGLLDAKRTLAEGVLDQRGDLSEIRLPTGRAAFMERLDAVLGARAGAAAAGEGTAGGATRALTPVERLHDDLVTAHGATLQRIFVRDDDEAVLVVLALAPERLAEEERRLAESAGLAVRVIDPATHESMLRLAEAGLIALPGGELKEVWPASGAQRSESDGRLLRGKALTDRAEHKLKAAVLLVGGGFAEEARAPAVEAARLAVAALAATRGEPEPDDAESAAEFLLAEEPDAIPGGPPHDAIRALSGDAPRDGEVARIEEFVSGISRMVAESSAPSRSAAG